MSTFTKRVHDAHDDAALVEAAGLRWLKEAEAAGGPRVAEVISACPGVLELERLEPARGTADAAAAFGQALARMHSAIHHEDLPFGTLPPEHPQDAPALFGPADDLLEVGTGIHDSWGAFHAAERLTPILQALQPKASSDEWDLLCAARDRIAAGEFDDAEPAALIHGDLWSGNLLWTTDSNGAACAALIDPAAHAGHRESDLALLQLFGTPHLDTILGAYDRTAPLREGWEDRVPVHQFFYLAAHWLLFGSGYRNSTLTAAQRTVTA